MGSGEVWVSKTVLLETEWVLRSVYEQAPPASREFQQGGTIRDL
jgi:hypothetical protein